MKSITIVNESYTGLLADVTDLLNKHAVNISDINVELLGNTGIIRLETEQVDAALHALTESNYHAVAEESVLVRLKNQPGALAKISRQLAEQQVDIRGMNVVDDVDDFSIVAITCSDPDKAREVLSDVVV
ncbi:hypothetical protein QP938_01990 [Porticoccaceae bacterium LTM1]|nr:hypothetical protein QP938_01990 [Porticoccaceae bacterium LTM1]